MPIILTLSFVLLYLLYRLYINKNINKCFFWYFLFSSMLWVIIPSILTMINQENRQEILLTEDIYIRYSIYEFLYYIILIFLLNKFTDTKPFYWGKRISNTLPSMNILWYILSISLILNIVYLQLSGYDYLDINDVELKSQQTTNFYAVFGNFALSLYFVIIFYYKDIISKKKYYISWILLASNIIVNLLHGSRIQFIFMIFIFVYFIFELKKPLKNKIVYVISLISLLYVSTLIIPAIASIRMDGKFNYQDIKNAQNESKDKNEFALQLLIKLNSINTGSVLVQETKNKPYLKPYLNSLLSPIPSFIYPSRPIAGSDDGTFYGLPSRRAAELITGDSTYFNVGVSTSAICLWQGGWLFYFFNLIISFFWFRYINSLYNYNHFYAKTLAVYFTLLSFFIIPTGDIIIKELLKQPLFYIIFILITKISFKPEKSTEYKI